MIPGGARGGGAADTCELSEENQLFCLKEGRSRAWTGRRFAITALPLWNKDRAALRESRTWSKRAGLPLTQDEAKRWTLLREKSLCATNRKKKRQVTSLDFEFQQQVLESGGSDRADKSGS